LSEETGFTTVYIARSQPEAEIVKGRLNCEDIPAIFRYESAGIVYGLTVDGLGQVEVRVPSHLARHAKEILTVTENEDY
jgi:hypothetical protein